MFLKTRKSTDPMHSGAVRRRIGWRRILSIAFGLFVLFLIAAAIVVYAKRFDFVENVLVDRLAQAGIEAELSVSKITAGEAVIDDIRLRDSTGEFFAAERVTARYQWPDVKDGKILGLDVDRPIIDLRINNDLRPDHDWFAAPGGSGGASFQFPPEGVLISDGRYRLETPYGEIDAAGGAQLASLDDMSADMVLNPSQIDYGDFNGEVSGPIAVEFQDGDISVNAQLSIPDWVYKDFSGRSLKLGGDADVSVSPSTFNIQGDLDLSYGQLDVNTVTSRDGAGTWSGEVIIPRLAGQHVELYGDWTADIRDISVPDPDYRQKVANTLTLYDAMSSAPLAANFSAQIRGAATSLMTGVSLSGEGRIDKPQTHTHIFLSAPLQLSAEKSRLVISPVAEPVYAFDRLAERLTLRFDANHSGALNIAFEDGALSMASQTGRDIQSIEAFQAMVKSRETLRGRTPGGRPARLAPFQAMTTFKNRGENSVLVLSGAVDYDGDIPGGYATGLQANGRLQIDMDGGQVVYFQPAAGRPVRIAQFDTVTDWRAENAVFNMLRSGPFFTRRADGRARLRTELSDISLTLIRTDEPQAMDLTLDRAAIIAALTEAEQVWDITGTNTTMTSDTIPSPGTVMTAPDFDMTVRLIPDAPVEFTAASPRADIETQLIKAQNLVVLAYGSPTDLRVNYEKGQIEFLAADLPKLPMRGYVTFDGTAWSGDAVTNLPLAKDTPIDVSYIFTEGRGEADILIESLYFSPSGLQPQYLVPALKGKIAEVDGEVSAKIKVAFGADEPLTSSGTARLIDMDLGTLPGPVKGVNADLTFSSFFPLKTDGVQRLTVDEFDPGFPLRDGEFVFEMTPDGVRIEDATWPLGNGQISLDPGEWVYLAPTNRMTLRIENVSLGEFLNNVGGGRLSATGNVVGELPIVISGVNVEVENGRLFVKDGGVIRYESEQTDAAAAQSGPAKLAFDALKEFHYQELEAVMNGPLDGNILIRMLFEGRNPEVLGGTPFKFNVSLEGELVNIARSFNMGPQIGAKIVSTIQGEDEVPEEYQTDAEPE